MISSRERGIIQILTTAQVLFVTLGYWLWFGIHFGLRYDGFPSFQTYANYSIVIVIAMIFEAFARPQSMRPRPGRVRRNAKSLSLRQTLWIFGAILVLQVFSRDLNLSRIFLVGFLILAILLLYLQNRFAIVWSAKLGSRFLRDWKVRTLVLGPKEWCDSIIPELNFSTGMMDLKRVVLTDGYGPEFDYLKEVASHPIDILIMPPRSIDQEIVIDLMRQGDRLGYSCWLPVEYTRNYGRHFSMQRVGRLDILTPPAAPLENTLNRLIKRAFDLIFASLVVVTILPVTALFVWVLHRLYSPGPLLFKQERVGRNGRTFQIYKFRSLDVENGDELKQVSSHDNRIFKGGGFIRKTSIDEFPQFLNVFNGDMSVVGPRPHLAKHDEEFALIYEKYGHRRNVKPGVTGLAQVKGYRGEIHSRLDVRHRACLDRFYIFHWDIAFDFRIVVMTFRSVIRPPKSAY
ncbi:MAG: lipopolysaccharide/colanic/teichoic acid biosynthesis glycosyltransferase [Akkermansiaceae bacterium]|jgi:lipopolysaccharide/colanic/teichoic acid biosynthesis glycosyltransferase